MIKLYQAALSLCFLTHLCLYVEVPDAIYSHIKPNNNIFEKANFYDSKRQPANEAATKLNGPKSLSYFGGVVSTGSDLNGDGYSDVLVGAPYLSSLRGAVYVCMSSPNEINNTV